VTYQCAPDPVNPANGVLRRYWNYAITLAQPAPPATVNNALLATNVAACEFTYATGGATERTGVVALTLQISQSGENVRLFQQVHVNNAP
jgi:MSHA biogenesis protein MshO